MLVAGRRAAETLMVDACVVERKSGTVFDETSMAYTDAFTPIYTGPCRVQLTAAMTGVGTPVAGERVQVVQRATVQLPLAVTGVKVDDRVRVTASSDPDLVGNIYRVRSQFAKTHATARRLEVEETQS